MPSYKAPYDTPTIDPAQDTAYRLADKHTPKYHRAWLNGIKHVGKVIESTVSSALKAYYYAPAAVTAVDANPDVSAAWADARAMLDEATLRLWTDTEKETTVRKASTRAVYDDLAQKPELADEAIAYAEAESSALVTVISEQTRIGIRGIIASGVEEGLHPDVIARKVRQTGIGLAEKGPHTYARLDRYRAAQMEAGVSGKLLEKRTQKFYNKLLRERAESIARTESIKSQNMARLAVWKDERKSGLISPGSVKVWMAGATERTCEVCVSMDGETVPLNAPFSEGMDAPPAHPKCRCTMIVRLA